VRSEGAFLGLTAARGGPRRCAPSGAGEAALPADPCVGSSSIGFGRGDATRLMAWWIKQGVRPTREPHSCFDALPPEGRALTKAGARLPLS
jgi:hypothetical protein